MTPDQKEAARQRMNHARAVRDAKRIAEQGTVATLDPKPHTDTVSGSELAPDLVLTVRQIHVGSFHGLWELCRMEPDGTKVVISDANTKAMIINLARNEIVKCRQ